MNIQTPLYSGIATTMQSSYARDFALRLPTTETPHGKLGTNTQGNTLKDKQFESFKVSGDKRSTTLIQHSDMRGAR